MADEKLIIDLWDVGQGNGTVVRLPDSKLILIDVGPKNSPIIDWIADNPRPIHAVAITHNDSDHAGSLPSLVKLPALSIDTIYMLVDRDKMSSAFQRLWRPVREEEQKKRLKVRLLTDETVVWSSGDVSIKIIYPSFAENVDATTPNKTSGIVCLFYKNETKIVWAGDAPMEILAAKCAGITPYLLDGPHHGAPEDRDDPQFKTWVQTLQPKRVFISVGTTNRHNHPANKYLKLNAKRGCHLICTQLTKLCDNIHVNQQKPVLPSAALLGLRPAHNGVPCRGCLRLKVDLNGNITPDNYDAEHLKRVRQLKRPQCL